MRRLVTAWHEDRVQLALLLGWLVAGSCLVAANWGRGWLAWVVAGVYGYLVARQALDVLVYRPRRLERTGRREQRGFWHW